jgi:hypothetical protein
MNCGHNFVPYTKSEEPEMSKKDNPVDPLAPPVTGKEAKKLMKEAKKLGRKREARDKKEDLVRKIRGNRAIVRNFLNKRGRLSLGDVQTAFTAMLDNESLLLEQLGIGLPEE